MWCFMYKVQRYFRNFFSDYKGWRLIIDWNIHKGAEKMTITIPPVSGNRC